MKKYRLYWSTDPRCVGYSRTMRETRGAWSTVLAQKPEIVGTARTVFDRLSDIQRKIGESTFLGRRVFRAGDGAEVPWQSIQDDACQMMGKRTR